MWSVMETWSSVAKARAQLTWVSHSGNDRRTRLANTSHFMMQLDFRPVLPKDCTGLAPKSSMLFSDNSSRFLLFPLQGRVRLQLQQGEGPGAQRMLTKQFSRCWGNETCRNGKEILTEVRCADGGKRVPEELWVSDKETEKGCRVEFCLDSWPGTKLQAFRFKVLADIPFLYA